MASLWAWWTLLVSSFVNVMACSSVVLILGDCPESCTFCITFRYVFLDLEDFPVEVPLMITLISLSRGRDNSSTFPFNFSSLWSHPRKFLNFSYLMRYFNLLLQIETLVHVMPMVSVEAAILVPIALVGISLYFLQSLQGRIVLDLHENLFKWHF